MQIVDHLLRILDRRCLAATRKQLARTLHQLLLPAADHRRMNPKFHRQLRQGLLPRKRRHRHARPRPSPGQALKAALCCFLFTPTSHASLDRSAFSLSHCPKNRSRRIGTVGIGEPPALLTETERATCFCSESNLVAPHAQPPAAAGREGPERA